MSFSNDNAEFLILCHALEGVATTTSGESERTARWAASESLSESLETLISLEQKDVARHREEMLQHIRGLPVYSQSKKLQFSTTGKEVIYCG